MLTANVCAADLLIRHKHPALYRIHAGRPRKAQAGAHLPQAGRPDLGGGDKPARPTTPR
jgi:ribonuclease R